MKKLFELFLVMLKIGLFTFGGGYAMIALLEDEFVSKRRYIGDDEFTDMVAIAESTPGPIAINSATFIGYKQCGASGAAVATVAVCIPSFVIIYVISLFFDAFQKIRFVAAAFRGIRVGVVFLILSAGIKMIVKTKKTVFNVAAIALTAVCMVSFSLFAVSFSSIFYILIGACAGLAAFAVRRLREHGRSGGGEGK